MALVPPIVDIQDLAPQSPHLMFEATIPLMHNLFVLTVQQITSCCPMIIKIGLDLVVSVQGRTI